MSVAIVEAPVTGWLTHRCRVACLQLHEDSTERLREALATEKQELLQDQSQQIATLQ